MIDLFPGVLGKPNRTKDVFDLQDFSNQLTKTQAKVWLTIRPGKTRQTSWFNFIRLHPDKPLPTICKASGNAKHCHWQYPKGMGIDGYKKGGSYPTEFKFPDNYGISKNQIGNSVPPLFMRAIASNIRRKMFDDKPLPDYSKMNYLEILESAWQDHLAPRDENAPTVISTFAGGGGSSLGYSMAGYKKLLAVEWDNNAVETYKVNFPDTPVYHGDIAKLSVEECMRLAGLSELGELDLLDGSPPCQSVSMAGKRILDDPRNQLYKQYVRLLRGLKPKIFVMENVSGMVKGKMKLLFAEIMRELKASGYQVRCKLMNTMYFHVPQSRERLIWIGVRNDLVDGAKVKVSFPKVESRPVMVREAFHGITNKTFPPLDLTVPFSYVLSDKSVYQCCPEHILKKYFPRMINNRKFNYSSYYAKRRSWLKPSCTIEKTYKDVCPIHPLENRHFTIEELKRIASFPDSYHLGLLKKFKKQWALLGNSVPPLFMRAIANHIRQETLLNIITSRRREV